MIPQRQQPAYDPMAQMMQILQFALSQNQQVQQQANQDRDFGLKQEQFAAHQAALKQQEQNAIISALSRTENAEGFQDPTALLQYLAQQGIQLRGVQMQQPADPMAEERAKAQAFMSQLGQ